MFFYIEPILLYYRVTTHRAVDIVLFQSNLSWKTVLPEVCVATIAVQRIIPATTALHLQGEILIAS